MRDLFYRAREECNSCYEWHNVVNEICDFISDLEPDYWEWFYDIGNDYPMRLQSYLIGLKMASEQLSLK